MEGKKRINAIKIPLRVPGQRTTLRDDFYMNQTNL